MVKRLEIDSQNVTGGNLADPPAFTQRWGSAFNGTYDNYYIASDNGIYYLYYQWYKHNPVISLTDPRLTTYRQSPTINWDSYPFLCDRSGADFSIYNATYASLITTKTITLTSGYSIIDYKFNAFILDNVKYFIVVYSASNGSNHYYGIAQITESGVSSLYTSSTFSGGTPNVIPAPCSIYPLDGWFVYTILNENGTFKLRSTAPGTSPSSNHISNLTFDSGYNTCNDSTILHYRGVFYMTLYNSSTSGYRHYAIDNTTFAVSAIHDNRVLYPTQDHLDGSKQIITYDLTQKTIVLVNRNYPGTHAIGYNADLTNNLLGTAHTYYVVKTTYAGSPAIFKYFLETNQFPLVSGIYSNYSADLVLPSKIETFNGLTLFLYSDLDVLLARLLVISESFENGLQRLRCRDLNAEIESISVQKSYNGLNPTSIINDQIKFAQYVYSGTIEGSSTNITIRRGYPLSKTLDDLAVICGGIGYVTPAGSIEFRTSDFDTGPDLDRSNANYTPNSYRENTTSYGKVEVYGPLINGTQYIATAVDSRSDSTLVYQIDYPTISEETTLDAIAQNILDFIKSGIANLSIRYFGYLYRGRKCAVNLSGWGLRFGKSEPVSEIDMLVLAHSWDFRANQSILELSTVPQLTQKSRISADTQQQLQNLQNQIGFSAVSAYINTNKTINALTLTKIVYDNVEYDLNSNYNASTGRFTAPVKGIYHVSAAIITSSRAWSAGDIFVIILYKNGAEYISGYRNLVVANVTGNLHSTLSWDISLNANDYIEIYYYSSQSTTTHNSNVYNRLHIHLVRRLE